MKKVTAARMLKHAWVGGVLAATLISTTAAWAADAPAPEPCVQTLVRIVAAKHGSVPPALALAVAQVESGFRGDAVSSAGARGVMQILPSTARSEFGVEPDRLWDPKANVEMGVEFLARLYDLYGGDWRLALSHYNGGSLSKDRGVWRSHTYTLSYVDRVYHHWAAFERQLRRLEPDADSTVPDCAQPRPAAIPTESAEPASEAAPERRFARFRLDPPADRGLGAGGGFRSQTGSGAYIPLTGGGRFR